ncbi:hypothetical protein D0T51_08285 [Parabacteroides sp. 52]|uniref:OmpP1/FadL family transporter n=1 Tax=unclassified Parabacteroides TaxID=2649774 RepID=UPI0013D43AA2|nr:MULTISPECIES: outer membrane protein transport protein [unclassified Parabacteroides]MDH6534899.1 long-subunit fatty acid transport protein [Parabacteroides sp. PM5-20]NDV55723.1 hypothetical protein [Parabacteroides sp. 52]
MKKISLIMATLALCGGVAFSQGQIEAHKFGQTELSGTARYMGMGGAFGALGGDISAMHTNPAGLAVYRSSEVVTTLSLTSVKAKTDWLGTKEENSRTRVNFDNIAYVGYFPTSNDVGIVGWNAGFSYNRMKNFHRNYTMSTSGLKTSLSDYMAERAFPYTPGQLSDDYAYDKMNDWLSPLGYGAGYIVYDKEWEEYYSCFGENRSGEWTPYEIKEARLNVTERGAIDQYNIAFGMNISDVVLLGANLAITDISYDYASYYDEFFEGKNNDLLLDNSLSTDGTGYSFNVGAIIRPTDFFRLGVAYNSPTWYKMTDYYYGYAESSLQDNTMNEPEVLNDHTPDNGPYTDYEYRSPDKWLFSAAAIIGRTALISVDYEMANYKGMRMYDRYGNANMYTNEDIQGNFKTAGTLRVGTEIKVTPQFAIRAGASWTSSPVKDPLKNGKVEVRTTGTIPNFTIDKGATNYTVGFGYRFTPNFYTDIACVLSSYKEDAYAFSNMINADGDAYIEAQPASLKTNKTRVALTVGYKF